MVLSEYNSFFVHIPKTAGQSMENFLLQSLYKNRREHGAEYLLRKNANPAVGPKRLAHLTYRQYWDLKYLDNFKLDNPYSFAFVRNPWSRVVSFYKYGGFFNLVSFRTFVVKYLPVLFKEENWFYKPQHEFICNSEGQIAVTFLGKFETLNTDFAKVAAYLGIPFNELPSDNRSQQIKLVSRKSINLILKYPSILTKLKFNKNQSSDYRVYYCEASKAVVAKLYAQDIVQFNYSF